MDENCRIDIQPSRALLDQPLTVRISGLAPEQEITVRSRTKDEKETPWQAFATFTADTHGVVDLSKQAPQSGTFTVTDPTALTWAMHPEGYDIDKPVPVFEKRKLEPLRFTITVEANGDDLAQMEFSRQLLPPGRDIIREPVVGCGLVGTLFHPAEVGPHPTVIHLGGTDGGLNEARGALLASYGFAVLSMAYFGIDPLPSQLAEIPLEYFENALGWLTEHKAVDSRRIGVYGYSKGGELALLLGANFPQIRAVAAFAPSSVIWQGLRRGRVTSSWTRGGAPLPFVPIKFSIGILVRLMFGRPVAFRASYERGLKDRRAVEAAAIAAENINGPILLVSGENDAIWPSTIMAEMLIERLQRNNFPHPYQHLKYKGAGHVTSIPYLPAIQMRGGLVFSYEFESNCQANIDAWKALLAFLKQHLY